MSLNLEKGKKSFYANLRVLSSELDARLHDKEFIKKNFNAIKEEVLNSNRSTRIDTIIQNVLEESNLSNA